MSSDGSAGGAPSAKRRGPFFEFHSTSVNFWSNNPLTNLFRKSGRKTAGKEGRRKRGEEGEQGRTTSLAQQAKRSSSCDALNQPGLNTRFDVIGHEDHSMGGGGTLMRNGTSKKKKSADNSAFSRDSAHSSSFSSLLHHRILLSSRGASPLVPHKIHKNAKIEQQKFGSKEQRRSSKSQQNIPRIIDYAEGEATRRHRRDHSLGAPSRVRQVPIVQLPSTSSSSPFSANNGPFRPFVPPTNPVAHTFFYEKRQEFVQSSKQLRKTSWEERGGGNMDSVEEERRSLALEEWMLTQPIALRRLEQHERIRLKMADERDAIQKKTFTKWVNQHLMKSGKRVEDLFVDLRDGNNLIDLLQSLSGDILLRENGLTRFHRIQNLQSSLEFLRRRNIKLVNIRPEDIVDGNGKLTLGLIWTIILNFQVSAVINQRHPAPPPIHDISLRVSASTSTQSRTQMMQQTMATSSGAGSSHSVQRTVRKLIII